MSRRIFKVCRVQICRMLLSKMHRFIGISLGALGIVYEVFKIRASYSFPPYNFCVIIFNILWICGICVENATLMIPLLIAEGFFSCLLSFYCFPFWLLTKIQDSSNIREDEFLEEFILPVVVNVTIIFLLLYIFIFKFLMCIIHIQYNLNKMYLKEIA